MQQPVNLTLTAEINDKTFPISSFTVNIPVHVNRTYRYEVIDSERAIAKLMPPSTNELIKRFKNAINAFQTAFETDPNGVGAVKSQNQRDGGLRPAWLLFLSPIMFFVEGPRAKEAL